MAHGKMSGQIFISYRRDDSAWAAGRLFDILSRHFASNQIFMDVDLDAGIDFVKAIAEGVASCDVLIAVIGGRWLISSDEDGKRRLDNPEDFVRLEIATALKRGIRVIPVLVEGVLMPRPADLPDDLKSLVRRQALRVTHTRFRADSERLIGSVERALQQSMAERIIVAPLQEEVTSETLDKATKDHPWVNSLGMKFVPVFGTQVLFSVWDTRVEDFETFVNSTGYHATEGMWSIGKDGWKQRGTTWKEPGFIQGPTHPVVGVNWNEAEQFCKWLTKRERIAGNLPEDREYRLPKDEEWSAGVGLMHEAGSTPEKKSGKTELYPWDIPQKRDKNWPPPKGAGNYAGEEAKNEDWPSEWSIIEGYNDGYPRTSPVGSFSANQFGLYDMGGNALQWCEDWYNTQAKYRVLRGASWFEANPDYLLASFRNLNTPDLRIDVAGFRCVVAVESSR
jgi:formylglycine-generating enzyme required for sulfatase activity